MNRLERFGMAGRLADLIVNYSTDVKPGELVVIHADPIAMPLIEAMTEAVLEAGGHPHWQARSDTLEQIILERGTPEQLEYCSPLDLEMAERADVRISMWAETNTAANMSAEPARAAARQRANGRMMKAMIKRMVSGEMRWSGTLYPTPASAQDARMSLRDYERFVYGACKLFEPDPAAAWRAVREKQRALCDFLQSKTEIRFVVPPHAGPDGVEHDGTDLRVGFEGSTWINCAGENNMPDGEVFTGPRWAEGHVNYTYPALHHGGAAEGVRLAFRDGRAVDATARAGEGFLISMLDQDEGARTMGEIAIGTNTDITGFSRNTLFDEKIGGTFHAAVGAGFPEAGNSNESSLHWDMVCELRPDEATGRPGGIIEADGEVFCRDGELILAS